MLHAYTPASDHLTEVLQLPVGLPKAFLGCFQNFGTLRSMR
jgi:hypothetical protein